MENKIIIATIECISEYGISKVTSRLIAEKAGINVAAINYYFRSKDNLISKALDIALTNAFDSEFFELIDKSQSLKNTIYNLFIYLFKGSLRYSNLIKAIFQDSSSKINYQSKQISKLNNYMEKICQKLNKKFPEINKEEIKISFTQCMYTILFTAVFPYTFNEFHNIDITTKKYQNIYIKQLVDKYF